MIPAGLLTQTKLSSYLRTGMRGLGETERERAENREQRKQKMKMDILVLVNNMVENIHQW